MERIACAIVQIAGLHASWIGGVGGFENVGSFLADPHAGKLPAGLFLHGSSFAWGCPDAGPHSIVRPNPHLFEDGLIETSEQVPMKFWNSSFSNSSDPSDPERPHPHEFSVALPYPPTLFPFWHPEMFVESLWRRVFFRPVFFHPA